MATRVNIAQYLENILNAVYGEEVRSSIHDSIEALHQVVEEDVTVVTDVFDWSTEAGTAADARAIHEHAILVRGKLETAEPSDSVNLNEVTDNGVYRLISSETYINSPLTASTTGWLIVYQHGDAGRNCMQIVYETGTSSRRTYRSYFRTFSTNDGWGPWQTSNYALDDTLSLTGYAADAKAVGDRIAELAYSPIEFSEIHYTAHTEDNLYISNGDPVEKGCVVDQVSYRWETSKTPAWVRLDGQDIPISEQHPTWNEGQITSLHVTSKKTWTLKAKDIKVGSISPVTVSTGMSVIFLPRVFWGVAKDGSTLDSAFLEGFRSSGSAVADTQERTFTVTAGTGDYIWYAYPADFGLAKFIYGGFTGGFKFIKQMTFTSKYGVTDQYYLYRSVQSTLGLVEITVAKA